MLNKVNDVAIGLPYTDPYTSQFIQNLKGRVADLEKTKSIREGLQKRVVIAGYGAISWIGISYDVFIDLIQLFRLKEVDVFVQGKLNARKANREEKYAFASRIFKTFGQHIIRLPVIHGVCAVLPQKSLDVFVTAIQTLNEDKGILSPICNGWIIRQSQKLTQRESFICRNILPRILFGFQIVSSLVSRLADAVIGSIACLFAIVTVGKFPGINAVACLGLTFPLVIDDLFHAIMGIIHPSFAIAAIQLASKPLYNF